MKKIAQSLMALSLAVPATALIHSGDNVNALTQKEVSSYSLNVRTGPSANSQVIDWLKKGQAVNVLNASKGWDYVSFDNGKKGYVDDHYLTTSSVSSQTVVAASVDVRSVTSYRLTLRNGPGANYKPIDYLKQGTKVTVLSQSGNWAKVSISGEVGYVNTNYLTASGVTKAVSTPVSTPVATSTSSTGKKLYLPPHLGNWTVYKVGHPLIKSNPANVVGEVVPDAYGGLTYDILGTTGPNSYLIKSPAYGLVQIYAAPSTGAQILNSSTPTPAPTTVSSPIPAPSPTVSNGSLAGKLIVIDPGHGGPDPGAQGYADEHKITYEIATKVQAHLQAMGARVLLTRTATTSCNNGSYYQELACRPELATKYGANAFVSIHGNSGPSSASGSEAWYLNANRGDYRLASDVLNDMTSATGLQNRGVKQNDWTVLVSSTVPSTLVETGFVTNPSDGYKLNDPAWQDKFAQGIAQGISDYFN